MNGRLLITCPDRHGIVAAVAGFLADSGANIISSDQHSTDPEGGEFFMRMEFTLEQGDLGRARPRVRSRRSASGSTCAGGSPTRGAPKRMAMLVSREDHCLVDLLWRHRRGELDADDPAGGLQPPGPAPTTSRASASPTTTCPLPERARAARAAARACDLVVLARYMRIL